MVKEIITQLKQPSGSAPGELNTLDRLKAAGKSLGFLAATSVVYLAAQIQMILPFVQANAGPVLAFLISGVAGAVVYIAETKGMRPRDNRLPQQTLPPSINSPPSGMSPRNQQFPPPS